jgi:hypothetical protein
MKTDVIKLRDKIEKEKIKYHDSNLILIPDNLEPKKDLKIWDNYYNLNIIYLDLITDYVMNEKELSVFIEDYIYISSKLRFECADNSDLYLYLMILSDDIFEDLKVFTIINEFYEGAANLKKFEKLIEEHECI